MSARSPHFRHEDFKELFNRGASSIFASYALAMKFTTPEYWANGTKQSSLSAMAGYAFTRSGEQGAYDAANAVAYYAANTPAINSNGFWSYGALTNLALYSQDFSQIAWNKVASTTTQPFTELSPDGSSYAQKLAEDNTTASHSIDQSVAFTAAPYTISFFVKMGTARYIQLMTSPSITTDYTNFDLQTGTIVGGSNISTAAYIIPYGNGWYRLVLTLTGVAASLPFYLTMINAAGAARYPSYAGSTANYVYVWQGQVLQGTFPDGGPIIRTTAAAASIGASALATTTNPYTADQDFIFWAVVNFKAPSTGTEILANLGGTTLNRISLYRDASNVFSVNCVGGTGGVQTTVAGGSSGGTTGRAAILYRRRAGKDTIAIKATNGSVGVGVESAATTFAAPSSALRVGNYVDGTFQPNAAVEGVYARTGTFTDADLSAILTAA